MTLAWVLERLGADTGDEEHYERALREVAHAIRIDRDRPEVQFQAGTLRARVGELRGALRHFERCFELDPDNFEAERYAERLRKEIRKDRTVTQAGLVAGVVVGSAAGAQLALLWIFFLLHRVSGTMLATTIPVLLGLLVLAFVLPRVIEFSFGGVRAVLTAPAPAIARGPSGELNIVSAQPAIGTGSRG
jgi:tetratricopeptide (TPR) repeat protein